MALLLIVGLLAPTVGCKTQLAPAGVYQGDTFLYNADATIKFSYNTLKNFQKWESDNHTLISQQWPQVTIAAERVRDNAPLWFKAVGFARQTYLDAKAQSNPTLLKDATANLQNKIASIGDEVDTTSAMVKTTSISPPPTPAN